MDVSFRYQITANSVECVYIGLSNDNFVVALIAAINFLIAC